MWNAKRWSDMSEASRYHACHCNWNESNASCLVKIDITKAKVNIGNINEHKSHNFQPFEDDIFQCILLKKYNSTTNGQQAIAPGNGMATSIFGKLPEPEITAYWRQAVSWTHNKWLEQTQILPMQRVQVMIFLISPDIWKIFLLYIVMVHSRVLLKRGRLYRNCIQKCTYGTKTLNSHWSHNVHPICRPHRRDMGVCCEDFGENWPLYNGITLYCVSYHHLQVVPLESFH